MFIVNKTALISLLYNTYNTSIQGLMRSSIVLPLLVLRTIIITTQVKKALLGKSEKGKAEIEETNENEMNVEVTAETANVHYSREINLLGACLSDQRWQCTRRLP